jgi:hypothetical protein
VEEIRDLVALALSPTDLACDDSRRDGSPCNE